MAIVQQIETPKCFDTRLQFKAWVEAARREPPPPKDGYCRDCTPEFKKRMVDAGRCGHPEVFFLVDKDGDMVGVRRLYKRGRKASAKVNLGAKCLTSESVTPQTVPPAI